MQGNQRPPRPISRSEEARLVNELPGHLKAMAIFAVNTGARDNVIANLQWKWLIKLDGELVARFFLVPREYVKGRITEKILILNRVAREIVQQQDGNHAEFVFGWSRNPKAIDSSTDDGSKKQSALPKFKPIDTMNNTAWQGARKRARLGDLHVHDLRHTFANRLRAANIREDLVSELLWHAKKNQTQHYMGSHIRMLLAAVETICEAPEEEDVPLSALIAEHAVRYERPRS